MYEPIMTSEEWLKSLGWASDACIEFQGFASESWKESNDMALRAAHSLCPIP